MGRKMQPFKTKKGYHARTMQKQTKTSIGRTLEKNARSNKDDTMEG